MKKETIILSLPYAMSIRNLIDKKFIDEFKNFNLIIFSPVKKNKNLFFKLINKNNIKYYQYYKINILLNLLNFLINNLTTIKLLKKKKILTLETFKKMHSNNCSNEVIKPFKFLNNKILNLFSNDMIIEILKALRFFMTIIFYPNYLFIFLKYRPQIFFTAHPFANIDFPLQLFSNLFNLKKVALIHSWDNLTSKFKMTYDFKKLLVWNNTLKKQAKYIYGYKDKDVKVIGVPNLEDFHNFKPQTKEIFFNKNNLDTKKKLITIFGPSDQYVPHIEDIIYKISSMSHKNEFNKKTQLWFRSHPAGNFNFNKFKKFNSIKMEKPPNSFSANSFNEIGDFKKDLFLFGNLINYSDIIVSFYSTTILDAIYFDKPVINPLINLDKKNSIYCKQEAYVDMWSHMKIIKKLKGVTYVKNYDQFRKYVNIYLNDKNFNQKGRRQIFKSQLNYSLGSSRKSIAYEIIN